MHPTMTIETTTPGADAPELRGLQEEAFSYIMQLSEQQLQLVLQYALKGAE